MKRKAVSCLLVLAAIMTMTPTIPTLAAENPDNTIQEATTTGTQGATITYQQDSAFTVTIPKTITLGQNKSATYGVKVKGDISGNETVTVTPDATVQLTDSNGKAAVTGTITQDITEFAADQVNLPDGGSTTGNIVANELTSGDWSGNFEFAVGIESYGSNLNGFNLADYQTYGIEETVNVVIPTYVTDTKGVKHKITGMRFSGPVYNPIGSSIIETIVLPDSVTTIGNGSFCHWTSLKNITIPDSVTSIGGSAFSGCSSLTNITIPDQVTELCSYTFSDCTSLTNITIPNSVQKINNSVFSNCTSLTTVTLPDQVSNILSDSFSNCTSLTTITYKGVSYTSRSALETALKNNNVTIDSSVFKSTGLTN